MPPKVRITKEMIIEAGFAIVRGEGADALNARTIAQRLGCSTQPVLYQFATVEEVRKAVYAHADAFHSGYILQGLEESGMPMLTLGLNYIRFAAEEGRLFRFLFQTSGLGSSNVMALADDPALSPMLELLRTEYGLMEAQVTPPRSGTCTHVGMEILVRVPQRLSTAENLRRFNDLEHVVFALRNI